MPAPETPVSGRYRLLGPDGAELESAEASFALQPDALVVQPRQQPPLRVDFADVDALEVGDYLFRLKLESGEQVEASMLGRRNAELTDATAEALSEYQAKNLLLHEPVGGESFSCDLARDGVESPVQLRVYATSLAVLPRAAVPFGIPLGEVASVAFDEDRYAIDLKTLAGPVSFLRLGRQSQPCMRLLESRLTELRKRTAEALAFLLPQVPSLTARRLAAAMPDGVPVHQSQLDAISPTIWPALVAAAADKKRVESIQALLARCPAGEAAVGLKETNARQDSEESPEATEGEETPEAPEPADNNPMTGRVAWFVFPIYSEDRTAPGNAVAVEAATRTGRATYLFRIAPPEVYSQASLAELTQLARDRVRSVSRALVALSFKREPIYLPDETIRTGAYARYRLALRLSAPLKASRANFLGRAIHGAGWAKQIDAALARK